MVVIPMGASTQDARVVSRGLATTSVFLASATEDVQSQSSGFLVTHVSLIVTLGRYEVAICEILHMVVVNESILANQLVPRGGDYHARLPIDFHLLVD